MNAGRLALDSAIIPTCNPTAALSLHAIRIASYERSTLGIRRGAIPEREYAGAVSTQTDEALIEAIAGVTRPQCGPFTAGIGRPQACRPIASHILPHGTFGQDHVVDAIQQKRVTWVSVEVRCSGLSASPFRSSFCWPSSCTTSYCKSSNVVERPRRAGWHSRGARIPSSAVAPPPRDDTRNRRKFAK